jgi:hypothetical protein
MYTHGKLAVVVDDDVVVVDVVVVDVVVDVVGVAVVDVAIKCVERVMIIWTIR